MTFLSNMVIKIKTEHEYKELMQIVERKGYRWPSGTKPTGFNAWSNHHSIELLGIHLSSTNFLSYCRASWYENEGGYGDILTLAEYKKSIKEEDVKLKVGDKVWIREDLREKTYGSDIALYEMLEYAGELVTIEQVVSSDSYRVEGNHWYWTEEMFDLKKDTEKMGRRTFRLVKEDAELKKGAIIQEACDDGDQEYVALNRDDLKFPEDTDEYFDGTMPSYGRKTVESQPKFFEEVVPATQAYVTKDELAALKEYLKLAAKKR